MQNPALVYADYDGAGTAFPLCTNNNGGFPEHVPGTTITLDLRNHPHRWARKIGSFANRKHI